MDKNEIVINKIDAINNDFGVYSNEVIPPAACECIKGEKRFSRFFYVVSGAVIFNKGRKDELYVKKSEIAFLPSDVTYKSEWDIKEKGKYIAVNFVINDQYIKLPEQICIVADDNCGTLFQIFDELLSIWNRGEVGYEIKMLSGVYDVIYNVFCNMVYRKIKSKNNVIYKGILYLENHYLEDITIAELAGMCHTSEGNFRRLFKKYKGMPPITYRNHLRIKRAMVLLNSGEYSVSEVAEAVNMHDMSYFYKVFRKTFGTTPMSLAKDAEN